MNLIPYEEFQIEKGILSQLKRAYAERKTSEYFKQHGVLPDENTIQSFYEIPTDLMGAYKRHFYAKYCLPLYINNEENNDGESPCFHYKVVLTDNEKTLTITKTEEAAQKPNPSAKLFIVGTNIDWDVSMGIGLYETSEGVYEITYAYGSSYEFVLTTRQDWSGTIYRPLNNRTIKIGEPVPFAERMDENFYFDPNGEIDDSTLWENAASAARNMGIGWNLGNTLDSNSGDIDNMWIEAFTSRSTSDYETAWGQPVATRELIHMFKKAGFNAIRVPVTWYPHMGVITVTTKQGADGQWHGHWDKSTWEGYNVDHVWMARVKEIVGYILDEDMYCILNVHRDAGSDSTAWLKADRQVYESVRERFCSLWAQIATEFESYGQKLIFESFSEMLDSGNTWGYSTSDAHEVVNMYNADFVSTVRATGGKNAYRNLILNTYAASSSKEALADFRLPDDSTVGHLMAGVHSYAPSIFAFDTDNPQEVFDESCESEVKGIIDDLNTYFVSKGIPCVLGEFGATSIRSETELSKQAECYVSNATKYNIPCFYWMGLSDGEDRSVPKWTKPDLKDAILRAFNPSCFRYTINLNYTNKGPIKYWLDDPNDPYDGVNMKMVFYGGESGDGRTYFTEYSDGTGNIFFDYVVSAYSYSERTLTVTATEEASQKSNPSAKLWLVENFDFGTAVGLYEVGDNVFEITTKRLRQFFITTALQWGEGIIYHVKYQYDSNGFYLDQIIPIVERGNEDIIPFDLKDSIINSYRGRLHFKVQTISGKPSNVTVTKTDEAVTGGVSDASLWIYAGNPGKDYAMKKTADNVFELVADIDTPWGFLVRTFSGGNWPDGSRYGGIAGNNIIVFGEPLSLTATNPQDIVIESQIEYIEY